MGKELAPKPHVQVKFISDPVRSKDYFPEWKPAFTSLVNCYIKHNFESFAVLGRGEHVYLTQENMVQLLGLVG